MKRNSSGLIINNNVDEFQRYKMERTKLIKQKSLEDRVEKLESDISEIKSILQSIQNRIS